MIVELPDPGCTPRASTSARKRMRIARSAVLAACGTPTSTFRRLDGTATVTGVGFWDFPHHQTGVAPNAIELHPVTKFAGANCH